MKALTTAQRVLLHAYAVGYRVDEHGVVWKPDGTRQRVFADGSGYYRFGAGLCGMRRHVAVHRLAAIQRFGADALFADGIQVRHLNNDKRDNSRANIALGSQRDNYRDNLPETNARKHNAGREALRKLSDADVLEIVRRRRAGELQRDVAAAFGVSGSVVSYIMTGRTYSHVTGIIHEQRHASRARKLSDNQARDLVAFYHETGASQVELARRYDLNVASVSSILRGRLYANTTLNLRQLYAGAAEAANDTTREELARGR